MKNKEELCGIIDALGALNIEELYSISKELSLLRDNVTLSESSIRDMCDEAEKEHLVAVVSWEEVAGLEEDENSYYIPGPNAFPEVPFELSEVIDILQMSKREVDLSKAADRFHLTLHKRIKHLESKIDSLEQEKARPEDLEGLEDLEEWYSDILNQYYDYSFWLQDDMSDLESEISTLSERIEALKSA